MARPRTNVLAVPLGTSSIPHFRESHHPWTFSLGSNVLPHPFLEGAVAWGGIYPGGTADTLFARSHSQVEAFTTLALAPGSGTGFGSPQSIPPPRRPVGPEPKK